MIRLFVGVPIPEDIRQEVNKMQGGIADARWTELDNYHITISFIGNVGDDVAHDVVSHLSTINMDSFEVSLNGMHTFSKGNRLSHLWTGVDEGAENLRELKKRVDNNLKYHDLPYDERKYTPHMTLARLKKVNELQVVDFIREYNLYKSRKFKVDEFVLYRSHNGSGGSLYIPQTEFLLNDHD